MAQSISPLFESREIGASEREYETFQTVSRIRKNVLPRPLFAAALGVRRWSISLVLLTAVVLTAHIDRGERAMLSLSDVSAVSKVSGIDKASLVCHPSPYLNVNLVPLQ